MTVNELIKFLKDIKDGSSEVRILYDSFCNCEIDEIHTIRGAVVLETYGAPFIDERDFEWLYKRKVAEAQ